MPGKDGSGPPRGGGGMGGNRPGAGPSGECVCTACGAKLPHVAGTPCSSLKCLKCGARMIRG